MNILDNPQATALAISAGVGIFKLIKELIKRRFAHRRELSALLDKVFEAAAQYTYDTYLRDIKKENPGKKLLTGYVNEARKRTLAMANQIAAAQGVDLSSLGHPRLLNSRLESAVRSLKRQARR